MKSLLLIWLAPWAGQPRSQGLFPILSAHSSKGKGPWNEVVSGQNDPNPALWLATQVSKMELSCPLGTTRCVPTEKFPRKPYNKTFIDQACPLRQDGRILAPFLFWAEKQLELDQYPAILTEQAWSAIHVYVSSTRFYKNLSKYSPISLFNQQQTNFDDFLWSGLLLRLLGMKWF